MEPECDEFGSREGLNIAKANVEKYFAVVGVLEEWQKSLIVMENYVPYFFTNVTCIKSIHYGTRDRAQNIL